METAIATTETPQENYLYAPTAHASPPDAVSDPLPLTVNEVRAQVNLIQEVMKAIMKKDVHYGIIPGCVKPTLYKAGAEKLLATFRLSPGFQIENRSDENKISYFVTTTIRSKSGDIITQGVGECSSAEEKYNWRKAICEQEWNATPENMRREKWKKYQGRFYAEKQIRNSVADIANTILKMAKKRSLIDATLTATAASDIFYQDVEDIVNGDGIEVRDPKTAPVAQAAQTYVKKTLPPLPAPIPAETKTPSPEPKTADSVIKAPQSIQNDEYAEEVSDDEYEYNYPSNVLPGLSPKKESATTTYDAHVSRVTKKAFIGKDGKTSLRYTLFLSNSQILSFFKADLYEIAKKAAETKQEVRYTYSTNGNFQNLESIELLEKNDTSIRF